MAKLPIIFFPDPILRKPALPVEHINAGTLQLAADMLETMYRAPGVGLAAPQVGVLRRIFVMDASRDQEPAAPRIFLNPEIGPPEVQVTMNEEKLLLDARIDLGLRVLMFAQAMEKLEALLLHNENRAAQGYLEVQRDWLPSGG